MEFSFHVLPIVLLPVCKNFCALAVEFTIGEFAFIGAAIGVGECALAVELAIAEAAHIKHTAGGGQGALSVQFALGPVAGQGVAVGAGQGAFSVVLVAFEKAVVATAIRMPGGAFTVELAIDKVAFVTQAGIVFVSAIAGFNATQPLAVAEFNAGEFFQLANQGHLLAGGQGYGAGPGLEAWLADGDVVLARVQFEVEPSGTVVAAVNGDFIANYVRAQHQFAGGGRLGLRLRLRLRFWFLFWFWFGFWPGSQCHDIPSSRNGSYRLGNGENFGFFRHGVNGEGFRRQRLFGLGLWLWLVGFSRCWLCAGFGNGALNFWRTCDRHHNVFAYRGKSGGNQ